MDKHGSLPGIATPMGNVPTQTPDGKTFIGGKSRELGGARPAFNPEALEVSDQSKEEPKQKELANCPACDNSVPENAIFCPMCGIELNRKDLSKALGVKFTEEDLSQYLFQGYLSKEIELTHGKKAVFRTLLPVEAEELETELANQYKDKEATAQQWKNQYAIRTLSFGWIKFDNVALGNDAKARYDRLMRSVGGALVDIASRKWSLFNRAVTAMLEDPDFLKN